MTMRTLLRFSLLLLMSANVLAADYPKTPQVAVVDDYFGTQVPDPYRWLEDADSAQTAAWVAAQNQLSLPFLANLPQRERLQRRLSQLWNYERYEGVTKTAGHYFYRRNDGLQNQSVLYVRDSMKAAPRILLDPNALAADGTVALTQYEASPDARWLAYGTAAAGSDWNEFRIRKVADGKDSAEVLRRIKFSSIAWTGDGQGFFYARYPDPPQGTSAGTFDDLANQALYYHRIGTPQAADRLIHRDRAQPKWGWQPQVTDDGRYLVVSVWRGSEDQYRIYVKDLGDPLQPQFDAPFVRLIDEFEADYTLIGNVGSRLYFRTGKEVQRGRIVAIDLENPAPADWQTIVAEQADTLQHAQFAGDGIVALYMHDATSRLRRLDLQGKDLGEIRLPGLGSVLQFSAKAGDPEVFLSYSAFNTPATNYRADFASGKVAVYQPIKLNFDPDAYVTEQVFYASRDGTRVPMFISYKKGLKRDGRNPVHLYGYGGFDISLTPSFSVPNLVWMESGGVYAVANLRGGGEYGKPWHEAGTQARKQNVFDDFIAAAEYLIEAKWSTPAQLAISGRSNGGLLVGATLNQRPELFAAALPGVGVMDMLRYHRFTIGWAWASDYGTSETAEGFRYLSAYSPYHTIRRQTKYPAVLVTTADHDDRVVPGHSFKYAAALQAAQAGEAPILIRIDVKAGHGAGKPIGKLIEEEADKLAFMLRYTQLP